MWHRTRHPLRSLPLLDGASDAVVDRLAALMTSVRIPAGDVLVVEGARNRQFFLIESGTVTVTRGGQQVAELGAGDFVGEVSLLGDGRANATVTATTDVQGWVSSSVEFDGLLHSVLGSTIQGAAATRSVA